MFQKALQKIIPAVVLGFLIIIAVIMAVVIIETKKKCISEGCNNGCLIVRQPIDRTYCYRGPETNCSTTNMYCINESEWNRYAGTSFSQISSTFFWWNLRCAYKLWTMCGRISYPYDSSINHILRCNIFFGSMVSNTRFTIRVLSISLTLCGVLFRTYAGIKSFDQSVYEIATLGQNSQKSIFWVFVMRSDELQCENKDNQANQSQ